MSMLSDQAKQLRGTAYMLDKIAIVSTPWIHANLTPMLREAADTIISLRDRLQDAEDARYDAGFNNGIKACLQQLDGLIHEGADVDEIQGWIDCQWEEEV